MSWPFLANLGPRSEMSSVSSPALRLCVGDYPWTMTDTSHWLLHLQPCGGSKPVRDRPRVCGPGSKVDCANDPNPARRRNRPTTVTGTRKVPDGDDPKTDSGGRAPSGVTTCPVVRLPTRDSANPQPFRKRPDRRTLAQPPRGWIPQATHSGQPDERRHILTRQQTQLNNQSSSCATSGVSTVAGGTAPPRGSNPRPTARSARNSPNFQAAPKT